MNRTKHNAISSYPAAREVCWLPTPNGRSAFGILDADDDPLGYGASIEDAWADASRTVEHEKELLRYWPH